MEDATLKLPKDLIEAAIEKQVSIAMVEAFDDKGQIINSAVSKVLWAKVDSEGKSSRYHQSSDKPFIQWALTDALRKTVVKTINEEIKRYEQTIKDHIKKELSKKNSPLLKQLVEGMGKGIVNALQSKWSFNLSIREIKE